MTDQVRQLLAELLGTFVLLLVGGLAILAVGGSDVVAIALGFGFALLAGLYAFGEISGGHFNPAVSLAAMLDGRIDLPVLVQYVVAQVAGALLAGLVLLAASSQSEVAATATMPAEGVGLGGAFLVEVLLAAVFVAVILQVTKQGRSVRTAAPAIALTYAAAHLAAQPLTGASVNPARSLGSAVIGNTYTDVWIFLTAPFVGAALGWVVYQLVVGRLGAADSATPGSGQ